MKLTTLLTLVMCGCAYTRKTEYCDSKIYCKGQLLEVIQKSKIFQDSKSFVDMTQINHPNETLRNFRKFMRNTYHSPSVQQLREFLVENFIEDSGVELWMPSDYEDNPKFIDTINVGTVRDFARDLVHIWPSLGRKVTKNFSENPDKYSIIHLPNGFIIPGGRFREMYYWDSYWIIKGLLLSGMKDTVKGMLENFIHLIEIYGFVPNGSRIYYLNRSQPPLLALMVGLYFDYTNNLEWLRRNVGILEKELKWWLNNRVTMVRKGGRSYFLAHFSSESDTPRPESYYEDAVTCAEFEFDNEKKNCYKNLRSGAESGWDFSSRWSYHSNGSKCCNLRYTQVTRVIPVDLNAYLCKGFKELSRFYKLTGDLNKSFLWLDKSTSWQKSIEMVFYNDKDGIWYDYDTISSRNRKAFYLSNFAPLWCETYDTNLKREYATRAVTYLKKLEIDKFTGGTPTSLKKSGEQWDMPNAFPPLQEILILGLLRTGEVKAKELATVLAQRWITANIRSYKKYGVMYEKYHVQDPEKFATGGEYTVQFGFGWTNGVALSLIDEFYIRK